MLPKIGFSLQGQYDLPFPEVIRLLAEAGFSAVSPAWSRKLDLELIHRCAKEHGLAIQSLHAPYAGIATLWSPGAPGSYEAMEGILACIDDCARYEIPIVVIHSWSGFEYTVPEAPDFTILDRIVAQGQEKGVRIAFENLEGEEFLGLLMARYWDHPFVGYCWDSGHAHCYPHKTDYLNAYGSKLIMTHIHDNRGLWGADGVPSGDDDLHFLPYDGNIDWESTLAPLKNAPVQQILNFELKIRPASTNPKDLLYVRMPLAQFIELAGQRARRIARLYEKILG